jgi:hypothetical protein
MPKRFAEIGDRHREIDNHVCSLDKLLELPNNTNARGRAMRRGRRSMRSRRASHCACSLAPRRAEGSGKGRR